MDFKKPSIVYTAVTNAEAHMIVIMLQANGVAALASEDQSGASLWAFGTITQFHKPSIWVDEADLQTAAVLIQDYEEKKRASAASKESSGEIEALCEECGKTTSFPRKLDGTTQPCGHCHAYLDVGTMQWDEDVGEPES